MGIFGGVKGCYDMRATRIKWHVPGKPEYEHYYHCCSTAKYWDLQGLLSITF
jgi:hypothetical protein